MNLDRNFQLVLRIQKGDKNAAEELIKENSGLIWSVVRKFADRGAEQEDLFQIGAMGMLKAVKRFDFGYDVKFSTYAVPMIMGEIKRFLRDDGIIKISRPVKELSVRIKQLQKQILSQGGETLTVKELSEKLDASAEDVVMVLEASREVESLNSVVYRGENSDITLMEKIPGEDKSENIVEKIDLSNAMKKLTPREKKIIFMRYFQDKTQSEVAAAIGVSQVQISRIEKRVLENMRKYIS